MTDCCTLVIRRGGNARDIFTHRGTRRDCPVCGLVGTTATFAQKPHPH